MEQINHATVINTSNNTPSKEPLKKPLIAVNSKDRVFAILFLIISILWIDFGLFGGFDLGYSIAFSGIAALSYIYTSSIYRPSLMGSVYTACAIAIAVSFTFYSTASSKFMLFIWSIVLLLLSILSNCRLGDRGWKHMGDLLRLGVITPYEQLGTTMRSLVATENTNSGSKKKLTGVLIGIGCAVPVLCIIIPLLSASDAAFEALFGNLFVNNLPRILFSVVLGVFLFVILFTAVFASVKQSAKAKNNPNQAAQPKQKKERSVNSTILISFLSMVSLIYVVYLLSQLLYLFNGLKGYTIAEYARRGFFEMAAICFINVLLISLSHILCQKNEKRLVPVSIRVLCLFICIFSLVIVSTVIAKLVIYMSRLGLTELRVYTSLFCIAAAMVIICVGIRMINRRFPYFRVAVGLLAAMSVIIALADVNSVIVRYNTEAYLSGQHDELDVKYLSRLDDGSIPYLVELTESDDLEIAYAAAEGISQNAYKYGKVHVDYHSTGTYPYNRDRLEYSFEVEYPEDFRDFNLQKLRACQALDDDELWDRINELLDDEKNYI